MHVGTTETDWGTVLYDPSYAFGTGKCLLP